MSIDKNNRRRLWAVLLGMIPCLVLSAEGLPGQGDPARAAAIGLKAFLNSIPDGREQDFGFANRAEFGLAYLGTPYELMTIHPRDLSAGSGRNKDVVFSLGQFRFPVLCNGKARALLTVAKVGAEWKAVEIGAAGLAASFDRLEQNVPPPGAPPRKLLLRFYQLKIDFAGYSREGGNPEDGVFVPLPSALTAIGAGPEEIILYDFPELLKIAREKFSKLPPGLQGDVNK